ncbi:MAG: antirestriction protein ArdA [Verrucomicrobiae bacterium]|nr:antirestriction protein ArdA [Verrucomicrobiae bacterium]
MFAPESRLEPKIYVACLASYNAGILHGKWIDVTRDLKLIWIDIKAMLKASPEPDAEEWAIHDYEGFGDLSLSEYESIEHVHALGEFIDEQEEMGAALLAHYGGDLEESKAALENFLGTYESLEDYARELTEETSKIPDHLAYYINYEAMARDMEMNGEVSTIRESYNRVHVFANQ